MQCELDAMVQEGVQKTSVELLTECLMPKKKTAWLVPSISWSTSSLDIVNGRILLYG